jgi:hypothetical protein
MSGGVVWGPLAEQISYVCMTNLGNMSPIAGNIGGRETEPELPILPDVRSERIVVAHNRYSW